MNDSNEPCVCEGCGQQYDRDPTLEVECPACGAGVGKPCVSRRPSGHVHSGRYAGLPPWGHAARDLTAAIAGAYKCNCGISKQEAERRLEIVMMGGKLAVTIETRAQVEIFHT